MKRKKNRRKQNEGKRLLKKYNLTLCIVIPMREQISQVLTIFYFLLIILTYLEMRVKCKNNFSAINLVKINKVCFICSETTFLYTGKSQNCFWVVPLQQFLHSRGKLLCYIYILYILGWFIFIEVFPVDPVHSNSCLS